MSEYTFRNKMFRGFLFANIGVATIATILILSKPDEPPLIQGVLLPEARPISAFTLIDHNFQPFTQENLKGQWDLISYGFATCPDICPTTLVMMNELNEFLLDTPYAEDTQFLMVSLDPARDTPIKLKPYIEYFNSDFIGVTGEFLSIHRFAKQLNVAFQKIVTNAETGDYTVDHSGHIALINPDGYFQGYYKPPFDLNRFLMTYKSLRASYD